MWKTGSAISKTTIIQIGRLKLPWENSQTKNYSFFCKFQFKIPELLAVSIVSSKYDRIWSGRPWKVMIIVIFNQFKHARNINITFRS